VRRRAWRAVGVGVRIVLGWSLSRRWRVPRGVGPVAISRQFVSSSPPENDDFCQWSVLGTLGLSQFLGDTADEIK
jgi:hypothetical protein